MHNTLTLSRRGLNKDLACVVVLMSTYIVLQLIIFFLLCLCILVCVCCLFLFFFFSSRRRHTRLQGDWSSDVCSSDLGTSQAARWPPSSTTGISSRGLRPSTHAPCRCGAPMSISPCRTPRSLAGA